MLKSAGVLNARTGRTLYEGALIREGEGFGCVHPWPELGDPSLQECLEDLSGARKVPLVRRALDCVAADGQARREGRSLFEGVEVPLSHATLPRFDDEAVREAVGRGFTHVKVKAGRGCIGEFERLRKLVGEWPELRWRVDLNGTGREEELGAILNSWTVVERAAIDFLEDPFEFVGENWKRAQKEWGVDFGNDQWVEKEKGESRVVILKPAVQEVSFFQQRRVVTSYMDHPVGQAFAAFEAARAGITEVSGLQTHGVFERDIFTEELGEVGPIFRTPEGTGLGFDNSLEKLPWVRGGRLKNK